MKTLKYRVGDVIRIRDDLRIGGYISLDKNANDFCNKNMLTFASVTTEITEVLFGGKYRVSCDQGNYYWIDTMFENIVIYKEI